jgi:hypothetical protein
VGKTHALRAAGHERILVLSASLPRRGTEPELALRALPPGVTLLDIDAVDVDARLRAAFTG